jgi:hypothetical protein
VITIPQRGRKETMYKLVSQNDGWELITMDDKPGLGHQKSYALIRKGDEWRIARVLISLGMIRLVINDSFPPLTEDEAFDKFTGPHCGIGPYALPLERTIRIAGTDISIDAFPCEDGGIGLTIYKGDPKDDDAPSVDVRWEFKENPDGTRTCRVWGG